MLISEIYTILRTLLTFSLLCYGLTGNAQVATKQAKVKIETEMHSKNGFSRKKTDTFLVRGKYLLEPIYEFYSNEETVLSTSNNKLSHKNTSAGSKLKWYCFTNFLEAIGIAFEVEEVSSSKKIEPYKYNQETSKKGINFVSEPYLTHGLVPADYVKEKDTLINGENCLLLKRTKVIENVFRGTKLGKIVQFRLAINPKLTFYAFPFVSEKIVQHFGGGAIVYIDGITENGIKSKTHYTYTEFTPKDMKLFDHYQELYNSNIQLVDKFKKN